MNPLVSVVIPTYNRAALVQRAVGSVLAQTHREVEVIVVDDGSTDGSAERLADRYRDEARVNCIESDHRGVAAARNIGLKAASGTHIAFLDSDDEWYEWKLEFQLDCLTRVPEAGMIWSDMAAVDPDGAVVGARYLRTLYRRHGEIELADLMESQQVTTPAAETISLWHGDIYRTMILGNLVHTSTVLATKDRLEAVGGFDEDLTETGEDFDFHLRTCRVGPVAFVDVPTTIWRVGAPDQLTRPNLMVQMASNFLTTIEKAVASDPARLSDRERRQAIARGHSWLGKELLAAGSNAEARKHLRAALPGRHKARTAALLVLSKLPAPMAASVKRVFSPVRRRFRGHSAG